MGNACGCRVIKGNVYCSKHKKYEGVEIKEKSVVPKSKKIVSPSHNSKKVVEEKKVEIILRKHKGLDKIWHSETGMVFKSATETYVTGKIVNDKLCELTVNDIKICKTYGFAMEEKIQISNKEAVEIKESISNILENSKPPVSSILEKIQKSNNSSSDDEYDEELLQEDDEELLQEDDKELLEEDDEELLEEDDEELLEEDDEELLEEDD